MPFKYERTSEGDYKCPHCEYSKANQSTVHMHIKAKHSGTFKHKCEHCDYETISKQNLDNHMICKHPTQTEPVTKDLSCPTCEYKCRTKAHLRSHYLVKHMTKEVNDLMKKTNDTIQCSCCHKDFPNRNGFLYHCVTCLPQNVADNQQHLLGLAL